MKSKVFPKSPVVPAHRTQQHCRSSDSTWYTPGKKGSHTVPFSYKPRLGEVRKSGQTPSKASYMATEVCVYFWLLH